MYENFIKLERRKGMEPGTQYIDNAFKFTWLNENGWLNENFEMLAVQVKVPASVQKYILGLNRNQSSQTKNSNHFKNTEINWMQLKNHQKNYWPKIMKAFISSPPFFILFILAISFLYKITVLYTLH